MLFLILIFMTLCSGSIAGAVIWKKKFGEILPVTFLSIVMILYVFGLLHRLLYGVYFVLFLVAVIYLLTFLYIWKNKNIKNITQSFCTLGFFVWVILFLILLFGNIGRVAYAWDEYSHWATVVKEMFYVNDFGTNTAAHVTYASYPPATALLQYFFQKVNNLFVDNGFSDWRLFFAYQLFMCSLIFPFIEKLVVKEIKIKKTILTIISVFFLVFAMPSLFYQNAYNAIYVDCFLGVLAGCLLGAIIIPEKYDKINIIYIILGVMVLVLSKDVGFMFAILAVILMLINIWGFGKVETSGTKRIPPIIISILGIAGLLFAKYSWKYEIRNVGASFAQPIIWKDFIGIITGTIQDYRRDVLKNYIYMLFEKRWNMGILSLSVVEIMLAFCVLFIVILYINKKNNSNYNLKSVIVSVVSVMTINIFYIFGLLVLYMFRYSEYEALKLASSTRYLNICFTSTLILILLMFFGGICKENRLKSAHLFFLTVAVLLTAPKMDLAKFISRYDCKVSLDTQSVYLDSADKIKSNIKDQNSPIYMISQGSTGYDFWALRYCSIPNYVKDGGSIGSPCYEGDVWTENVSPEDWMQDLRENFGYVMLFSLNDDFKNRYNSVFEDNIIEGGLYRVNRENGKLSFIN